MKKLKWLAAALTAALALSQCLKSAHGAEKISQMTVQGANTVQSTDVIPFVRPGVVANFAVRLSDLLNIPSLSAALASKQSMLTFSSSLVNSGNVVTLVNDSATPGNSKYYGTNGGGVLGYYTLPGGGTVFYQTVQSNATPQNQRSNLNFTTNFSLSDSAPNDRTTVDLASTIGSNTTGNAATSTALAATPSQCSAGNFSTGIAANGNANCSAGATGSVTGVTGTAPIVITGGASPTPNVTITQAATAASGYLSAADWNTFNGKQAAISNFTCASHTWFDQWTGPNTFTCTQPSFSDLLGQATLAQLPTIANNTVLGNTSGGNSTPTAQSLGDLTDAGTDGITVTGGSKAVVGSGTSLSQHVADATHNGYLSSSDWSTFNAKQAALSFTSPLHNTSNTVSIDQAGSGASGYLSSTDWNTFNNKQAALSNFSCSANQFFTSFTGPNTFACSALPATVVQTNQANTYTSGPQSLGTQTLTLQLPNASSTGTTLNKLAKLTGVGTVVITSSTDTGGAVGVVVAGAGTTGSADVAHAGQASCVFDGGVTQDDYVILSASVGGDCRDSGSSYPTSGQVVGRVLSATNAAAGTYTILVFPAEIQAASSAGSSGGPATVSWTLDDAVVPYSYPGPCHVVQVAGSLTACYVSALNSGTGGSTTVTMTQFRSGAVQDTETMSLPASSGNPSAAQESLSATMTLSVHDMLCASVTGVPQGSPEKVTVDCNLSASSGGGTTSFNVNSYSTSTNLSNSNDVVECNTATALVKLTLVAAGSRTNNRPFYVKNTGLNECQILPSGSDTIEGDPVLHLSDPNSSVTLFPNSGGTGYAIY